MRLHATYFNNGANGGGSNGAGSSSSGDQCNGTSEPFPVVIFARIGIHAIGVLLFRLHAHIMHTQQRMEIPLIAVSPDFANIGIADALMGYAEVVASQRLLGEPPKLMAYWHCGSAIAEYPKQTSRWDAVEAGEYLQPPPHANDARLLLQTAAGTCCAQLERLTAAAVSALVSANPAATEELKGLARMRLEEAQQSGHEHTVNLVIADGQQQLPGDNELRGFEGLQGRSMLLWGAEDAQFLFAQVGFIEMALPEVARTPTAAATRIAGSQYEINVDIKLFRYDEVAGEYVVDDKKKPVSGHELFQCPTVVWASDREVSMRCGMAIDIRGNEVTVCTPWIDLAVKPCASSSAFQRQLSELATACCSSLSSEIVTDWRPQLMASFSNRLIWETDAAMLMKRVRRHIENHEMRPPSFSADSSTMAKEPWRCASWDEVRRRAACIDILSHMEGATNVQAGAAVPACSDSTNGGRDGSVCSRKGGSGKGAATPCTTPRTLELYCGRAGYSAHQKQMGNNAFFLDWNREYVSQSFVQMPEYDEGGQVCQARLSLCPLRSPLHSSRPKLTQLAPSGVFIPGIFTQWPREVQFHPSRLFGLCDGCDQA